MPGIVDEFAKVVDSPDPDNDKADDDRVRYPRSSAEEYRSPRGRQRQRRRRLHEVLREVATSIDGNRQAGGGGPDDGNKPFDAASRRNQKYGAPCASDQPQRIHARMQTSVPTVFAAGDCAGVHDGMAVILPQTLPGIVIGSIFIFVLTMGEYGTVLVVGQNYVQSVGTIVNSYIVGAVQYPQGAAAAVLLVLALIAGVFTITRFSNLREDL